MTTATSVFVGIGSNIDKENTIKRAIRALNENFGFLRLSTTYETEAVGFEGPDFFNLVVNFETVLPPVQLADRLRQIEFANGRQDPEERFSPRTLDLDLLLYGDAIINEEDLNVPRKDVTDYPFVLGPLAELVPDLKHPILNITYQELWKAYKNKASMKPVNLKFEQGLLSE